MTSPAAHVDTVVFDIDGTLVDSNYHHTIAWHRAFRAHGHDVPCWRIHRCIGMGGDRLVAAAAGQEVEDRDGDAVRKTWEQEYDEMLREPTALPGARELLSTLRDRGMTVVLASSAIPRHASRALELLGADERVDEVTTSEDAEESKPDPELLEAAIARADARSSVLVGDSVWDVEAANRVGIRTVAVLTGGFSEAELRSAGAAWVLSDTRDLLARLDDVVGRRS
ncbi:HAD family hydrolase [Nocardioides coralli]|uniref:HAD family hydrolase n=1 Tax=Nocardioides coralli TaxID=2872154 RepID=UPI001CA43CF1|nr:HAD family hydrolase [Nocardioides coralli]QZY30001.1 HAD family hydrolase [Nocardioides coralli]